jgi:hypothetical protein
VKGEVYGDLTELMHHVEQYLGHGKGCLCEDCDHDSRPD